MIKINLPIDLKPGFYLVKTGEFQWFNVIAEVYGDSPFFKIRGWDRVNDNIKNIKNDDITEWGIRLDIEV